MKKLFQLFLVFLKIGAFTVGGGYAMVGVVQVEIVDKKKWIGKENFVDMLSLAQSSPGPIAVNTAVFVGYSIGGVLGAITSVIGAILPCTITILIIAIFFSKFNDNKYAIKIFKAVRPAVVAVILGTAINMFSTLKTKKIVILLPIAIGVLVSFFNIQAIFVIIASILVSLLIISIQNKKQISINDKE